MHSWRVSATVLLVLHAWVGCRGSGSEGRR
jgi:hypothetical protein